MSDLRTRIAAVCGEEIRRQRYNTDPHGVTPVFDMQAMADAIIKDLNLTEDAGVIVGCSHA